jgi:hypothetical protein
MTEGRLAGYAQFPGSDCLNGGVIRMRDGRKFMRRLGSHHYLLLAGRHGAEMGFLGQVFDLAVEEMC